LPGSALDTLKKLRILIRHAIDIGQLKHNPSLGIRWPKIKEIRAWTDQELAAFERRWPLGTKQRTPYALMLYLGTARVDAHRITWPQLDDGAASADELCKALAEWPRSDVTVINTEYGRPFTVDGYIAASCATRRTCRSMPSRTVCADSGQCARTRRMADQLWKLP
jgi:hypothetical protein